MQSVLLEAVSWEADRRVPFRKRRDRVSDALGPNDAIVDYSGLLSPLCSLVHVVDDDSVLVDLQQVLEFAVQQDGRVCSGTRSKIDH